MTREHLDQSISFHLNSRSGVPPYLQLVQQVKRAIAMGQLEIGDRLPTVKQVVTEVAVNPNTVLKAYRELEHEGLVEGRQGVGVFVAGRPAGPPPDVQAKLVRTLARWVDQARAEGLDDESIAGMVRSLLNASWSEASA